MSNALKEHKIQVHTTKKTLFLIKHHTKALLHIENNCALNSENFLAKVIWSDKNKMELFNHNYQRYSLKFQTE